MARPLNGDNLAPREPGPPHGLRKSLAPTVYRTGKLTLGPPPERLDALARGVWLELQPQLERVGIGSGLDAVLFEMLVHAVCDYRRAVETGSPFSAARWRQLVRLCGEFGLSPSSRTRLVAIDPAGGQTPHPARRSTRDYLS